jgi:hypothetical protein
MWKKKVLPEVKITVRPNPQKPDENEMFFEVKWPLKGKFDAAEFLDVLWVIGANRPAILNILITAISKYGNDNNDAATAILLIDELKKIHGVYQDLLQEEAQAHKLATENLVAKPLIRPSDVHQHHFIANKIGFE